MALTFSAAAIDLAGERGTVRRAAEIAEKCRVTPVHDAGHHHRVELGDNVVQRRGGVRRIDGEARGDLSRTHVRSDRALLNGSAVVGDPVRDTMQVRAQGFRREVPY